MPAITKGRFAAAAILMLSVTVSATAQAPQSEQPTETDLHAAYCTVVLQYVVSTSEALVHFSGPEYDSTAPDPNDSPEWRAVREKADSSLRIAKATLESQKEMLRKIDLYLKPRVSGLNPIPLQIAKRSAQDEWNRMGFAVVGCQNECRVLPDSKSDDLTKCNYECAARAMPDATKIQEKIKSCQSLEWLPF
jgi:hypothetical protein